MEMDLESWIKLGTFILGIFIALFSIAKYSNARELKRNELQDEKVDNLFKSLNADMQGVKKDVDENTSDIKNTREQMHNEFVKRSEVTVLRKEIRDDFNALFAKMGGLSKDLNQLIGAINGKVKND